MNITGPNTTTQVAGSNRPPARAGQPFEATAVSAAQGSAQSDHTGRPVRINRASEQAALFAYNRQAQVHVEKNQAQIDEYV